MEFLHVNHMRRWCLKRRRAPLIPCLLLDAVTLTCLALSAWILWGAYFGQA